MATSLSRDAAQCWTALAFAAVQSFAAAIRLSSQGLNAIVMFF